MRVSVDMAELLEEDMELFEPWLSVTSSCPPSPPSFVTMATAVTAAGLKLT